MTPIEDFGAAEIQALLSERDRLAAENERLRFPNGKRCEACHLHGDMVEFIKVRTTNGALNLCPQCLDDVNRKNPELARLKDELERKKEDYDSARGDLSDYDKEYDELTAERDRLAAENERLTKDAVERLIRRGGPF